jgi:predicted deacylase
MRKEVGKHKAWITLLWVMNLLGAALLALLFFFNGARPAAYAAQPAGSVPGSLPTLTPAPTRYYLPTVTPNPRSTQPVISAPTAFVLPANGQKPGVIGYSVSGRPIEVYVFGQGEKERLIVSGIHGGYEWNTITLADQIITYLTENPGAVPSDMTLYIIRNLNPDGDARDHGIDGRVNDHGVDLNRNFPVNWSSTWDREGCFDQAPTTSGLGPASEPETRVMMNFLSGRRIQAMISYHSAGLGIFPGGEPWEAASVRLAEQLAGVTTYPFPPILTGCVYTGTLADYAVSRGIAAVDMELTNHRHTDFRINLKALQVLFQFQK